MSTATLEKSSSVQPRLENLVLRVCGTQLDGRVVRIRAAKCTIGADPQCTLRLRGRGLAPMHCLIVRGPADTVVRRWSSGTRLNGRAFDDASLRTGDRLSLGPIELEVIDPGCRPNMLSDLPDEYEATADVEPPNREKTGFVDSGFRAESINRRRARRLIERLRAANAENDRLRAEASPLAEAAETAKAAELRIAELEQQRAELESEVARLRDVVASALPLPGQSVASQTKTQWLDPMHSEGINEDELAALREEVERHTKLLDELRGQLADAERAIDSAKVAAEEAAERDAALTRREQEIETRENHLLQRVQDFQGQQSELQSRLEAAASRETEFAAREEALTALETRRHNQLSELDQRKGQLEAREADIARRSQEIDARCEPLNRREAEIAEREAQAEHRLAAMEEREAGLDRRQASIDRRDAEAVRRQESIEQRESELAAQAEQVRAEAERVARVLEEVGAAGAAGNAGEAWAPAVEDLGPAMAASVVPTSEEALAAAPIASRRTSAAGPVEPLHDDDDIDSYMAQLLERVRAAGGGSVVRQAPREPAVQEPRQGKPVAPDEVVETENPSDSEVPRPEERDSGNHRANPTPRATPSEKGKHLSAMRELANLSTQEHLLQHARRHLKRTRFTKLLVASAGSLAAVLVWVIAWRWNLGPAMYYSSVVGIVVALLWWLQYARVSGHLNLVSRASAGQNSGGQDVAAESGGESSAQEITEASPTTNA